MPKVTIYYTDPNGVEKQLTQEGGCFAILGRCKSITLSLKKLLGLESQDGRLNTVVHTLKYHETSQVVGMPSFDYLCSHLPFMRCLSKAEKGYDLEFNIKDYQLNEVMHSLFWVRALCLYTNKQEANKCLKRFRSKQFPDFLSVMLIHSVLKRGVYFSGSADKGYSCSQGDMYLYGGDGISLEFHNCTDQTLLDVFTGEYNRKAYKGYTFKEHCVLEEVYPVGIQDYGQGTNQKRKPRTSGVTFLTDLVSECLTRERVNSPTVRISFLGNTYGSRSSSINSSVVRDCVLKHGLSVFDELVQKRGLQLNIHDPRYIPIIQDNKPSKEKSDVTNNKEQPTIKESETATV